MIPYGWTKDDYPACWDNIAVTQELLKVVIQGGLITSAQLKACEKYGGLKKADLESACHPNNPPYINITILIDNYLYIATGDGECQMGTVVANTYENRDMTTREMNHYLLTLVVMWGAWNKNPKFNQKKTLKGFMKAAFGEEG